ncbi:MAG: DUF6011 domain-containing protein [Acidimicrobiales bacterium]
MGERCREDESLVAAREGAAGLGRRFTVDDLDRQLRRGALAYARGYQGDFDFMVELRRRSSRGLSDRQVVGVLNCLRAEMLRGGAPSGPDLSGVPDGSYAVANASSGLTFLRVSRPRQGRFAGVVLIDQIVGDELCRRGHQPPGGCYRGTLDALVTALAVDPLAAAVRYGRERRSCGLCGRPLTAEHSREVGIGPVCGERLAAVRAAAAPAEGADNCPGR